MVISKLGDKVGHDAWEQSQMKIYTYLHTYKLCRSPMGEANNDEEKRDYVVVVFGVEMLLES